MTESGQALLIAVLLGILLLLAIPVVVFLNLTGTMHHVASAKRDQGTAIAEEGLSYSQQIFSVTPTTWTWALQGTHYPTECNSNTDIIGADGGHFRMTCNNTNPRRQSYQVYVRATSYAPGPNGSEVPTKAIEMFLSKKTLGVDLPTGLNAPLAVQMGLVPVVNGTGDFRVHWGPIVVLDPANNWTIPQAPGVADMNTYQYPRKFAVSGITGGIGTAAFGNTDGGASLTRCPNCSCASTTDQKEYWACSSLGFSPPIDLVSYANNAAANTNIIQPTCNGTAQLITATPAGSGYFDLTQAASGCQNGTAYFGLTNGTPYTVPASSAVIYVNGNAAFANGTQIDFKEGGVNGGGAFIITGDLTVNGVSLLTNVQQTIRRPPSYYKEYPYTAAYTPTQSPAFVTCSSLQGSSTIPQCYLPFRGFLYVQGNMTVQSSGGPSNFQISGVVRVDQQLTVNPGNIFVTYLDDEINRSIQTTNFQLQFDAQEDVPAS